MQFATPAIWPNVPIVSSKHRTKLLASDASTVADGQPSSDEMAANFSESRPARTTLQSFLTRRLASRDPTEPVAPKIKKADMIMLRFNRG